MPGQTQSHQLLPAGDRDFFRFDASAGEILEFAETSATDVYLTMFDQDGVTVLAAGDSPESRRIEYAQAAEVANAHREILTGHTTGKIALLP